MCLARLLHPLALAWRLVRSGRDMGHPRQMLSEPREVSGEHASLMFLLPGIFLTTGWGWGGGGITACWQSPWKSACGGGSCGTWTWCPGVQEDHCIEASNHWGKKGGSPGQQESTMKSWRLNRLREGHHGRSETNLHVTRGWRGHQKATYLEMKPRVAFGSAQTHGGGGSAPNRKG